MHPPRTTASFIALGTREQFDGLLAASGTAPVVLFKHSPTCGTSAQAYDELEALLHEEPPMAIHLVDVLSARPLSQAIAAQFGIRHESPQVLIIRDGRVVWHGSHWRVTADAVRTAAAEASTA